MDNEIEQNADDEIIVTEEPNEEVETEENSIETEIEGEDEDIITIDGESQPVQEETQKAPTWVTELRKTNRALKDEIRKLKEEKVRVETPSQTVSVPSKPTLEQFDYDAEEFEVALENWHNQKLEAQKKEQESIKAKEGEKAQWQKTLDTYQEHKQKLRVKDFDDAQEEVTDKLSVIQQSVILSGADNPAVVVYALGKNKAKIEELAKITDPVKFAFAIAKLESKMKVEKKSAPAPERTIKGTANASGIDSTLESLRREAERTNDYTKVNAYKKSLRGK